MYFSVYYKYNNKYIYILQNNRRRRTPGGVFLFLLKHHDSLTTEQQKAIFSADKADDNNRRKFKKSGSHSRERKVEELKKQLSEQEKEMPALSTRKDHYLLGSDLSNEQQPGNRKFLI